MIKECGAQPNNIKTAEEWELLNSEWEKSGQPQKRFCKRRNIPYATFVYWRSKLAQTQYNQTNCVAFQEIKVANSEVTSHSKPQSTIKVSLPGNIIMTLPIEINEQVLTILFKSLRGLGNA